MDRTRNRRRGWLWLWQGAALAAALLLAAGAAAAADRLEVAVGDSPALGPAGAPVTVIEFVDYQ